MENPQKQLADLIHRSANDLAVLKGFIKKSRVEIKAENFDRAASYLERSEERLDNLLKYVKDLTK